MEEVVEAGWARVGVSACRPLARVPPESVARVSGLIGESVILCLPVEELDPCALAQSLLYSEEDSIVYGRVRKRPISVLMNLLGLRQVREVVEAVRECRYIASVGEPGKAGGSLERALEMLGLAPQECPEARGSCRSMNLFKITEARLRRL